MLPDPQPAICRRKRDQVLRGPALSSPARRQERHNQHEVRESSVLTNRGRELNGADFWSAKSASWSARSIRSVKEAFTSGSGSSFFRFLKRSSSTKSSASSDPKRASSENKKACWHPKPDQGNRSDEIPANASTIGAPGRIADRKSVALSRMSFVRFGESESQAKD